MEDSLRPPRFLKRNSSGAHRAESWDYGVELRCLTPRSALGLPKAMSDVHRQYAAFLNARRRQTGHVFQGRFHSAAMDEAHLHAAVRYVALNPVKAGLVADPRAWPWSSTAAHLNGKSDGVVAVQPVLDRIPNFADLLRQPADDVLEAALTEGQSVGRPLMSESALREIEDRLGRRVLAAKRGRKPGSGSDRDSQLQLV